MSRLLKDEKTNIIKEIIAMQIKLTLKGVLVTETNEQELKKNYHQGIYYCVII